MQSTGEGDRKGKEREIGKEEKNGKEREFVLLINWIEMKGVNEKIGKNKRLRNERETKKTKETKEQRKETKK